MTKCHDWKTEDEIEIAEKLSQVICPQCKKPFRLTWVDYGGLKQTLWYRACPSGGVYDMGVSCPHCNYEEAL